MHQCACVREYARMKFACVYLCVIICKLTCVCERVWMSMRACDCVCKRTCVCV